MSLFGRYSSARLFKWDWLIFVSCLAFFAFFPNFDLWVTQMAWSPDDQFRFADQFWVRFSYVLFAKIHFVYIVLLFYFLLIGRKNSNSQSSFRKRAAFLLMALLLGPGLVVNYIWKENWGRARPIQVVEFGGQSIYTPPLQKSQACEGNCSFVSGHAAGAFFLLSLAWVFRRRRWFWFGLVAGSVVGLGRLLQGGHFLSDLVFAFWSVYFSSLLVAMGFNFQAPKQQVD